MYSSKETAKIWETERGGNVLYNHGSSLSKGVLILLNPKLDCQIDEEVHDKSRFLSARIICDNCQIILANIYTPSDINQQLLFFKELQKLLGKFAQEMMIIGFDFSPGLSKITITIQFLILFRKINLPKLKKMTIIGEKGNGGLKIDYYF